MGGKEGSRGYVYQGIVAVLESFSLSFWDKIYVEFPTDDDKVDIALSFGNNIVRAIQVKSTNNTFTPQQIKQWIRDLTNDYEYKCFFIYIQVYYWPNKEYIPSLFHQLM